MNYCAVDGPNCDGHGYTTLMNGKGCCRTCYDETGWKERQRWLQDPLYRETADRAATEAREARIAAFRKDDSYPTCDACGQDPRTNPRGCPYDKRHFNAAAVITRACRICGRWECPGHCGRCGASSHPDHDCREVPPR